MEENTQKAFEKLEACLQDLTKTYRSLLEVVRKEKELLLSADREGLDQNNSIKEDILFRLRAQDTVRVRAAVELAQTIGADSESPRLLELAQKMPISKESDKLRNLHSALDTLIRRITEINKDNEAYAASALKVLDGAINDVKENLTGKKTYKKEGGYKSGPTVSGNFVSKEA